MSALNRRPAGILPIRAATVAGNGETDCRIDCKATDLLEPRRRGVVDAEDRVAGDSGIKAEERIWIFSASDGSWNLDP